MMLWEIHISLFHGSSKCPILSPDDMCFQ